MARVAEFPENQDDPNQRTTRRHRATPGNPSTRPARPRQAYSAACLVVVLCAWVAAGRLWSPRARAGDWPRFRGPGSSGVAAEDETGLPVDFDITTGRNVAWRAPLLGRGPSSPIVVGQRVIVTASSGAREDRLHTMCFDSATGRLRWHRQLWATGSTVCNSFGAVAASTPASDGQRVYALFSSNDLACFDLDGNLQWYRGLGYENPFTRNDVGMASSPLVVGSVVVVQLDSSGVSFAAGIDTRTGRTRWRIDRDQGAAWTSPVLLHTAEEKPLVLLQGRRTLAAVEPESGRVLGEYEVNCHTIASAATWQGRVYLPAEGLNCLEFDPAEGSWELLWHENRLRSANPSPTVHAGRAYVIKPPGIVVCGDAKSGEERWQLRLNGPFWASPVLADGKLYCVSHRGLVQVVGLGEKGELLGTSQLEEGMLASPAVSGRAIYFRSDAYLWKIAAGAQADLGPQAAGEKPGKGQ